jgi:hypothetical protein
MDMEKKITGFLGGIAFGCVGFMFLFGAIEDGGELGIPMQIFVILMSLFMIWIGAVSLYAIYIDTKNESIGNFENRNKGTGRINNYGNIKQSSRFDKEFISIKQALTNIINASLYQPFALDADAWEMLEAMSYSIFLQKHEQNNMDRGRIMEYTKEFGFFQKCFVYQVNINKYTLVNREEAARIVERISNL